MSDKTLAESDRCAENEYGDRHCWHWRGDPPNIRTIVQANCCWCGVYRAFGYDALLSGAAPITPTGPFHGNAYAEKFKHRVFGGWTSGADIAERETQDRLAALRTENGHLRAWAEDEQAKMQYAAHADSTCRHTEIVAAYLDLLKRENATLRHALENVLCYESTRWTVCDDVACGHHKCARRRAEISHDSYVEPYGGGASVLLAKPRSRLETWNDLDGAVGAFFRCLRDEPEALVRAITLTPFSRAEVDAADVDAPAITDLERARRLYVRSWQTIHGAPSRGHLGWRCEKAQTGGGTSADAWVKTEHLYAIAGMVVLCGYHSALYDQLYGDWLYLEHTARQQSHAVATEVLWLNAAAARAGRQTLFAHAECHDAAVAVEEDAG